MRISLLQQLTEDTLLLNVFLNLQLKDILTIRQTCRRLNNLTRYRSVWLDACNRFVIDEGLPFPYKTLDGLDAVDLEKHTRRALALKQVWTGKERSPRRMLSFMGGPLNGLQSARFVLKRRNEWIITISEGIWPVIGCWDLQHVKNGSPVKVGEWFCKGATIGDVAVDASLTNDACFAVSIDNYARKKRYVEIQKIKPSSTAHDIVFETLKVLDTDFYPVLLNEDIVVLSDEFSQLRVVNWRTGGYAILTSSEEANDVIQHNKCLQVLFAYRSILVARSRSIDLFPEVDLRSPQETVPEIRPLRTCSFGWIDGIAMTPMLSPNIGFSQTDIAILARAEQGNPWESDIHTVQHYLLHPLPNYPAENPSPYEFPPLLTMNIAAKRDFMRCPTLALGPAGTSLWVASGVGRGRSRTQDLWSMLWHGSLRKLTPFDYPTLPSKLLGSSDVGKAMWTSMDYVESRGCIALGAVDGSVKVLYLVD